MSLLAALPLLTQGSEDWGGHHWWPLWWLFWAALIGVAVWLILRRRGRGGPFDDARKILADRFARGELTGDEYRQRLDELERRSSGASAGA